MKRIVSILVWSAISAAFIGPGTVTTASAAGCRFGYSLLWALVFSTIACLTLQEASARLTIATGKPLARVMGEQFGQSRGWRWVPWLVVFSVVLGCAAYQAGNILGAVAGAAIGLDLPSWSMALIIGIFAGALLFMGTAKGVARVLGAVVGLMGVAFLLCAVELKPSLPGILEGSFVPSLPEGAGMLALGLIGTTVVPYNLFLGSGLARGQKLSEARLGLCVAIPLGGIISMGILVVGTTIEGEFSFDNLAAALQGQLGAWSRYLFAFGLFAAGLSSAITAPLAAALSVRGIFSRSNESKWKENSWRYRCVWILVLAAGLSFGLAQVKPIPVILLAQALNGAILPLVAIFLWIAVNDRRLMHSANLCGRFVNVILGISVLVALVLGASGVLKALFAAFTDSSPKEGTLLLVAAIITFVLAVPVIKQIVVRRRE
ncbi:MAG: Nramp family divalent metal transporter [Planctomycetota bacterium]